MLHNKSKSVTRICRRSLVTAWSLLCIFAGVMWIRSYSKIDTLSGVVRPSGRMCSACSIEGRVILEGRVGAREVWRSRSLRWVTDPIPSEAWACELDTLHREGGVSWLGTKFWAAKSSAEQIVRYYIVLPYWILMLLLCAPGVRIAWKLGRCGRRRAAKRCLVCGYDIRANAANCPECGSSCSS